MFNCVFDFFNNSTLLVNEVFIGFSSNLIYSGNSDFHFFNFNLVFINFCWLSNKAYLSGVG